MAKIPDSIGPYKVSSSLGRGGTSQVYRAVHPELKKTVVLKKLTLRKGTTVQERFKREAEIMMSLQHPNIVRVFDIFKEGRSWVIVQEYVEGLNLSQLIHLKGNIPSKTAAWICYQSARALHYVHRQGIIHRDIKPSNIFISKEGKVKLGDFGIAAKVDDSQGLTMEGASLGTPAYMPPEQVLDPARVDRRADVYALGISFFEAMTGRSFQRSLKVILPLITAFNGRTIERATRKRPWLRYQNLGLMKLRLHLGAPGGRIRNRNRLTALMASRGTGKAEKAVSTANLQRFLFSLLLFLSLAAVPLLGTFAFKEWIFPSRYGRVRLQIQVPSDSPDWLVESPRARIFRQSDETLGIGRPFRLIRRKGADMLSSRTRYLPSGYYRVRLEYLDGLEWISFYLPNRNQQKASEESALVLNTRLEPVEDFPLDLSLRVEDCLTGETLMDQARIDIGTGEDRWASLASIQNELRTDRQYRIRVTHPGYQPFIHSQYFSVQQRHAVITAALVPEPGLLYLEGTADGVSMKINGGTRYLNLEQVPRWKRLRFDGEPLYLQQGNYQLVFQYAGEEYPVSLLLQSGQARWIRWETSDQGLELLVGD